MIEIKNLPPYHERYVLAKHIDGAYWYWGSWNCEEEAYKVAMNIGAYVFDRIGEDATEEDFQELNLDEENLKNAVESLRLAGIIDEDFLDSLEKLSLTGGGK